jgi:hypothetical protein
MQINELIKRVRGLLDSLIRLVDENLYSLAPERSMDIDVKHKAHLKGNADDIAAGGHMADASAKGNSLKCPTCTYVNKDKDVLACRMCSQSLVASSVAGPERMWACAVCTFHNAAMLPKCEICSALKPTLGGDSSCQFCKLEFSGLREYEGHLDSQDHQDTVSNLEYIDICDICNVKSYNDQELKAHLRSDLHKNTAVFLKEQYAIAGEKPINNVVAQNIDVVVNQNVVVNKKVNENKLETRH